MNVLLLVSILVHENRKKREDKRTAVLKANLTMSSGELMFLTTTPNNVSRKLKWGTASSNVHIQRITTC